MHSAFPVALRRMRAPLIATVAVYAIAVLGLVLIPGIDTDGNPAPPMSFFHAFYFVSFTATTIGFGELPVPFSNGQRLWVTVCIYLAVFGWTYTILSLLALMQDKPLQQAVAVGRFRRAVRRIGEPFYILCGYGETGTLLARPLINSTSGSSCWTYRLSAPKTSSCGASTSTSQPSRPTYANRRLC